MAGHYTFDNARKTPYIASQMIPRLLLASIISGLLSTSHAISRMGFLTPWTLVAGISLVHSSILLISVKLGYLAPLHFATPRAVASQKPKSSLWSLSSWSIPVVIPLPLLITTWFISICWFTVVALSPVWALFVQSPDSDSDSSWVSGWLSRREHGASFPGSAVAASTSGAWRSATMTTEMSWVLSFVGMVFAGLVQTVLHFWIFLLGVQVLVKEEEEGKGVENGNGGNAASLEEGMRRRPWGWDLDYAYSGVVVNVNGEEGEGGEAVDALWLLAEQGQQQWPKELEVGDDQVEVNEPQEAEGVILFSIPESEFESDDEED